MGDHETTYNLNINLTGLNELLQHNRKLDKILEFFLLINKKNDQIMATLADVQAKNQQLLEAVAAEDNVIDSAVLLIEGNVAVLADIKAQLAAAIAAGGDPAQLQTLSDSIDSNIADVNAKKDQLAAAVAAGTPSA